MLSKLKKWLDKPSDDRQYEPLDEDQLAMLKWAIVEGLQPWEVSTTIDISDARAKYEMNRIRREDDT